MSGHQNPARHRHVVAAAAGICVSALVLTGCGDDKVAAVKPAAVALDQARTPDVRIGVLVTTTSELGEGSQWLGNAEGARVASYRYSIGDGKKVTLDVVDDLGSSEGAADAVKKLASDGVSGIVVATSGSHVAGALKQAQASGIAALLPYETSTAGLPDNAWLTGPSAKQDLDAVTKELSARDLNATFLISSAGRPLSTLDSVKTSEVTNNTQFKQIAASVAAAATDQNAPIDSVVVDLPTGQLGVMVAALEAVHVQVPILLGPDARSSVFAHSLTEADGTNTAPMSTVGVDAGDLTAAGSSQAADRAASFFAALRLATSDPKTKDLFEQQDFSEVAASADIVSHDAVIAIATAATKAKDVKPDRVLATLPSLKVTGSDGIAGPELDFTHHTAIANSQIKTLQATASDPGLRGTTGLSATQLFWYPTTDDTNSTENE